MPVPSRFERDNGSCEWCDKDLGQGGITVMHMGYPVRLFVECAIRRFEEMIGNGGR